MDEKPKGRPKKKATPLEDIKFLSKAQLVCGFEPDIDDEMPFNGSYSGAYILRGSVSKVKDKPTILAFLEAEGITPLSAGSPKSKQIRISAADYHTLVERYQVVMQPQEVENALNKFKTGFTQAEFMNHNAAFGASFQKVVNFLRAHDIGFTAITHGPKYSMGDHSEMAVIQLTAAGMEKLQSQRGEIMKAAIAEYAAYQQAVNARQVA